MPLRNYAIYRYAESISIVNNSHHTAYPIVLQIFTATAVSIFVSQSDIILTTFKEHVHSFRNNTVNSRFARLEIEHRTGAMEAM
jgi:hypothetical protein